MLCRQSVKVTYAHRRRRVQDASKKLLSSPLEVLPPDADDLTHTQMARRMLKRSRRVALAEQLADKNVEHIREHLAKRIKRTRERISNPEPTEVPFDVTHQDAFAFQTPFSSQPTLESAVTKPLVPEQMSPVPVAKRVMSRTSSRDLKENSTHSQTLASPFSSRPGSVASSPKRKDKGRSSRRVSRISLYAKSRTLSGVLKENARRVSRKDSTVSLQDTNREPSARRIKHQRYSSTPSTSYMRAQFAQEDWIVSSEAYSHTFDDCDKVPSPGGSVHSNASFYADQPQSYSTPVMSRLRKLPDLNGYRTITDNFLASLSLREDPPNAGGPDVEMLDSTVPPPRQTIHLSENSIFSSSDEFTVAPLPALHNDGTIVEKKNTTDRNKVPVRVRRQVPVYRHAVDDSQAGHSLARSFVAEYDVPLPNLDYSPAPASVAGTLDLDGIPKLSVGVQPFGLPGTSPAHGGNLVIRVSTGTGIPKSSLGEPSFGLPGSGLTRGERPAIRTSTNPGVPESSVGKQPFGLPGTSPVRDETLMIRTFRNTGALAPPISPPKRDAPCPPSSPVSDLALELRSMDTGGVPDAHSNGETHKLPVSVPLKTRSLSLQVPYVESTSRKPAKRLPARNRAGTIRASDFAKPGVASSNVAPGLTVVPLSNARRTRSGTVVGPDSKLADKGTGLPSQAANGAPVKRFAPTQPDSESESDDELLLKSFWVEDLEYLGLPVPPGRMDAEADELNLGGL